MKLYEVKGIEPGRRGNIHFIEDHLGQNLAECFAAINRARPLSAIPTKETVKPLLMMLTTAHCPAYPHS